MYDSPPPVPRSVNVYAELGKKYARPALAVSAAGLIVCFLIATWQSQRATQQKLDALVAALAAKPADAAPAPQTAAALPMRVPEAATQAAFAEPKKLPPLQAAQPPFPTMPSAVVPASGTIPRELEKVTPSAPGIAAADILIIEAALRDPRTNLSDRIPLQLGGNEFTVRQDGTVSLGGWGSLSVAGLTPEKAANAVKQKLAAFAQSRGTDAAENFVVTVDVKASQAISAPR